MYKRGNGWCKRWNVITLLYPQLLLFAAKHTLFTIFLHYKATLYICV
ncbi:hypothetical protein HMPREF1991_00933 [Hoylesella loescheii DSM 19665 = JCM 12249 = ATCC 15930]|uniref:Uncharacterized protein n=1 Tax=Hoylesella loescheii DSM 19665 = JCM 12249 = ATCC 15930 TaxID=1122985 RepID=A0A069QJE8_HOYLO|nr:hypothetical protein HMPREF1991_00933 [Hoylesella loescheii DSM 19665 = JCM 12249 = ATCC 15930]